MTAPGGTDNHLVLVAGRFYRLEVAEPACGQWHRHDDPHPDGTPGQPSHHHHDHLCERRTALLVPIAPTRLPLAQQVHDGPVKYRRMHNGSMVVTDGPPVSSHSSTAATAEPSADPANPV